MPSTTETGHHKNVANFEDLLAFCQGYGTSYNPNKNALKVANMTTQLNSVKVNMTSTINTTVAFNNAVNNRKLAFEGLKKLCTRLVAALDTTNASKELVKDAITVNRKVQGGKLTKADAGKTTTETPIAFDPNAPVVATPKTVSNSQQSYDSLIEHFSKLIAILSTEPTYLPNENDLKIATLNTLLTTLKNSNTLVSNTYTTASNARIARNHSLYNKDNGLLAVAKEVKLYIKSVYGATSPQFKQVKGIEFRYIAK
jgi:hypothetical protein